MDVCPPEIHSYIAYLVCLTDHGPAIRSLSQVSRYFWEISQPFLHRTIHLSQPKPISYIGQKLTSLPQAHLRHVRNLFISFPECSTTTESLEVKNSILKIITLCAPSLHLLIIDSSRCLPQSIPLCSRVFRTTFPRLHDLTLAGFYPFPNTSSSLPNFPLLRRLHLHGNRNPHGLLQMGSLAGLCPKLAYLQVSGLDMAISFALELEEALSALSAPSSGVAPCLTPSGPAISTSTSDSLDSFPSPSSSSPTPGPSLSAMVSAKLPHTIQHIVVQPAPELAPGSRGQSHIAAMKDRVMMESLRAIGSSLKGNGEGGLANVARYTLLERPSQPLGSSEFRRMWLERL